MNEKTKIKGGYIIAFDGAKHRYLKKGELVYQGETITYVGEKYEGEVDRTIDAREKVVSPGFVCTHAHLAASPLDRSFIEDQGNPQFYYSGLYEYLPILREVMDPEMHQVCLAYSLGELLRGGTTTVVELGPIQPLPGTYSMQRHSGGRRPLAEKTSAGSAQERRPTSSFFRGDR